MNRSTTLFGTALLAATVVVLAVIAGGVTATAESATTAAPQVAANDTTANATAPGAQLAGVVGVQQTEVDSDLDNRTFGLRVANADSDAERAAIIAERQNSTRAQLASQTDRLADLREARANGTISNAEYRARVATVAAQAADAERDATQLNRTARRLPDAVRERNNINVSAIERLRTDARALGGPETAEIARSIGGTTARNPMAGGGRGPPMWTPGADRAAPGSSMAGEAGERGGQAARGNTGQGATNTSEQAQTPGEAGRDRNATPTEPSERRGGGNNENAGGEPNDDSDDAGGSRSSDNVGNSGNSNTAGGNPNRP